MFDDDREFFIDRLGTFLSDTETQGPAWALIPHHSHLLLKTGATLMAAVMERLLADYAMPSNRKHKRHTHQFQMGVNQVWMSKKPGLSQAAISRSVARGPDSKPEKYDIGKL